MFCGTKYRVFVICNNVDNERKALMKNMGNPDNFIVELIECENAYQKKDYELGAYISATTYIRLNLPGILNGIDKLLYLDGDTIIQEDLGELYGVNMDRKGIAGSIDFGVCVDSINWEPVEYIRSTLPNYSQHYFNAGVLLMNLDHLRKTGF